MESAPTVNGGRATNPRWPQPPGRPQSCVTRTPCRGRFHIGPVYGGAGPRGRDKSRPYGPGETLRPNANPALPYPCRGAHCAPGRPLRHAASFKRQPAVRQSLRHGLRPCHLPLTREAKPPQTPRYPAPPCADSISARFAVAQSPAGGINPAPTDRGKPCGRPQTPRCRTPCRGRCSHRPGDPAPPQTPPGGYGTRPCEPRTIPNNPGRPPRRGCVFLRFGV